MFDGKQLVHEMNVVKGYNKHYVEESLDLEQIKQVSGKVLLEFGTDWCGFCKGAQKVIADGLIGNPDISHIKVVDGKGKKLGRLFKVKLWPTLILLQNGVEVGRVVRPEREENVRELLDD